MFMDYAVELKNKVGYYPTIKEYKFMVAVISRKLKDGYFYKTPEVF